jgi:[acyl-carrier-protein] S-malonyltransferase
MGEDIYENHPAFRRVFDLLTDEEKNAAFEGPESELVKTEITQPVLLAFALGVYETLKEEVPGFDPAMAAGLSLGEYSALTASGVFTTEQALDIVRTRGRLMAECAEGTDTEMTACIGAAREDVERFVKEANAAGHVETANYNCPGQIVIAGTREGVEAVEKMMEEEGAGRCIRLTVSGPFHTSYMEPASEGLAELFEGEQFGEMQIPVLFNCTGKELAEGESIKDLLVEQVKSSVMFEDQIRNMIAAGVDTFVEIGPGKALTGFVKKTDRSVKTINIDKEKDIAKAAAKLGAE